MIDFLYEKMGIEDDGVASRKNKVLCAIKFISIVVFPVREKAGRQTISNTRFGAFQQPDVGPTKPQACCHSGFEGWQRPLEPYELARLIVVAGVISPKEPEITELSRHLSHCCLSR
jgi:hypothetical protein